MTNKEFVEKYQGRRVKMSDHTSHCYWYIKDWIGIVKGLSDNGRHQIITETIPELKHRFINSNDKWMFNDNLTILEEEPQIIVLPENHYPCPRCKSLSCKGLDRLDCVLSKKV